jgi:hypothetical protein
MCPKIRWDGKSKKIYKILWELNYAPEKKGGDGTGPHDPAEASTAGPRGSTNRRRRLKLEKKEHRQAIQFLASVLYR